MGLGTYPDVSLSEAQELAADNRKLVKQGTDPLEARVEETEEEAVRITFTTCAARYIKVHRRSWRNAKHARQWVSTLKSYARPKIGNKPIDEINTQDVLEILTPI